MVDDSKALFTIGMAAEILGLHPRTLRSYEKEGLIKPARRGKWRYYSTDDIKWIECIREMIHVHGMSIKALKKLLTYTPCWNIANCSKDRRKLCTAIFSNNLVPKQLAPIRGKKLRDTNDSGARTNSASK
ncbi:MAG: MerR family transcriptional regulator [Desulfobulbaceae bacterium]|nr:MerR family transcriptional regulator [Desulfobulbaceae bacterium]